MALFNFEGNKAVREFLLGKGSQTKKKPIFDPQQEDLLNQILGRISGTGGIGSGLQNLQNILGGDEESFKAFERPARRGFEQETLPTIAERFTSTFGPGSKRSSAYGQAVGTAGRELEENLLSKRIGMQTDALRQLLELLGPALQARQQQYVTPRQPGFLESLGVPVAQSLAQGLPSLLSRRSL